MTRLGYKKMRAQRALAAPQDMLHCDLGRYDWLTRSGSRHGSVPTAAIWVVVAPAVVPAPMVPMVPVVTVPPVLNVLLELIS
jgi:hypothetical protein